VAIATQEKIMYRRIEDLPQDVKDYLPEQAQRMFLTAFNCFVKKGCDKGSAFQLAWRALDLGEEYAQSEVG
jgi:cation transport regulator